MSSAAKSADFLPLTQLIKKVSIQNGSDIQISEGYDLQFIIHRNLFNLKLTIDYENFENFMRHVENKKIVLIADEAGMGKSTILTHIALKLKENYRDNCVKAFKGDEDEEYEFKSDSDRFFRRKPREIIFKK